jgi:leader peptidase (prepilin peptidase)/N-methyltransferase
VILVIAAGVLGLLIGSFLNVCIVRVRWAEDDAPALDELGPTAAGPAEESIVHPPSACRSCGAAIAWYDNVPLLSFALLRGRCRQCRAQIGWRYPAVETVTGALFAVAAVQFGAGSMLLIALPLLAALVLVTAVDLEHQVVPLEITVLGSAYGVLVNALVGPRPMLECILGVLLGHGIVAFIIAASLLVIGQQGMGEGDGGLLALLGACLGWRAMLLALFVAVMVGGVMAVFLLLSGRRGRREAIPFGPYIALGGAVGLFWGEDVVTWYVGSLTQ